MSNLFHIELSEKETAYFRKVCLIMGIIWFPVNIAFYLSYEPGSISQVIFSGLLSLGFLLTYMLSLKIKHFEANISNYVDILTTLTVINHIQGTISQGYQIENITMFYLIPAATLIFYKNAYRYLIANIFFVIVIMLWYPFDTAGIFQPLLFSVSILTITIVMYMQKYRENVINGEFQRNEKLISTVFDETEDAYLLFDAESGKQERCNKAGAAFGLSEANVEDLLKRLSYNSIKIDDVYKAIKNGLSWEDENTLISEGKLITVSFHIKKIQMQSRELILARLTDIMKVKEAQNRLEEQAHELESMNKLMVGREMKMIELKEKLAQLEGDSNAKNNQPFNEEN